MAVIETWFTQDLQQSVKAHTLCGSLFSHNGNANRICVSVTNGGVPAQLSGTVSGYVVDTNGATVPCTGSLSGNVASILLPAAAYIPGNVFITIMLTSGTTITTLCAIAASVVQSRTDTQVNPGSVVTDWTNTINAALQTVEGYTGNIIATPYASLTYPVPLGKYCIYNDLLYRCISPIASSESWTASHWVQVKLADDVSDLKSALSLVQKYPFDPSAQVYDATYLTSAVLQRCAKAIKNIELSVWNDDYIYYVGNVLFNYTLNGNPLTLFQIKADKKDGSSTNLTAYEYQVAKNDFTGLQTFEFTGSATFGGKARILIDFDELNTADTVGFGKNVGKLSTLCYNPIFDIGVNPNVIAGKNQVPLKAGNQSSGGVSIAVTSTTVTFNNANTNAVAFFISDQYTLAPGKYLLYDGRKTKNNYADIRVFNTTTNAAIAYSVDQPVFEIDANTNVKLLAYSKAGGSYSNYVLTPCVATADNLSNEQLTYYTNGLIGVDSSAVTKALKKGYYPFKNGNDGNTATNDVIRNAIIDCTIFGGDKEETYYIETAFVNSSALNPAGCLIYIKDSAQRVCEYNKLTVSNTHQFIYFSEMNNSGITAVMEVDFTNVPDNYVAQQYEREKYLSFSADCIVGHEAFMQILVPDTIYATVGYETNIYWEAAIRCLNLNNYVVEVTGAGMNLGNRWSYTPVSAETTSITIRVRDEKYMVVAEKTVSVIAKAHATGTAKSATAIHIGDSMIDNAYHLSALETDMANSNITYTIEGTRTYSEGRGGWTSTMYVSSASDGGSVTNAFYNPSTQTFDFSYYMAQNTQLADPDIVFIFLGTNDIKGQTQFGGVANSTRMTIKNIEAMIESIHTYKDSIKIIVETPAIGAAEQYPFARMYNNNAIKESLHKFGIQTQVGLMLQAFSGREAEYVYVIPTGLSLDNVNGFPTTTTQAAARISKQITVQSDCYHPTAEGYHQFADCEYGFIRHLLN